MRHDSNMPFFAGLGAALTLILVVVLFAVCERVTVPPAAKGKILSTAGYSADVKETGRYWLFFSEEMVVLDTSTHSLKQPVSVKMADDLDLSFEVRFRTRVGGSDRVINAMFNDIAHNNYQITLPMIYQVYGSDVVQTAARSVLSKYRTKDVSANYDKINQDLQKMLSEQLANSPLEMSNVVIGNITWPAVITAAIEKQQERELAITTEANEQAVRMVQKENELEMAKADYEIRMTRARAIRDENKLTAEGLNPILLQYRQMEVMEKMAENKNAVFMPFEAMQTPGAQSRIYNHQ